MPDLVAYNPDCFLSAIASGLPHDFTDTYKDWGMNDMAVGAGTWNGHVYGWAGDRWEPEGLVYDREYLKEVGMEKMPTDMFMEGKWDYESFRTYLAELQSKLPDGKYAIGVYPLHWTRLAANANGVALGKNDGTVNLANDAVIEAIEFYQQLMNDGVAYPMGTTTNEEGQVVGDIAYAGDDERIVLSIGGAGAKGFCPLPWNSNYVTCSGDYTTISDNYHAAQFWWHPRTVTEGADEATGIPYDMLMQILIDYDSACNNGEEWHVFKSPYQNPNMGTTRNFTTEDDMNVFDWVCSRSFQEFAWFMSLDGGVDYWTACRDCLRDRLDARSTLESYQSAGEQAMKDSGWLD